MALLLRHLLLPQRSLLRNTCTTSNINKIRDLKSSRIVELFEKRPLDVPTSVKGWVKTVRKMKENLFVDINDGSCTYSLQVVLPRSIKPEHLSYGASVVIEGKTAENPNGQLELRADRVVVVGPCIVTDGYPFAGKVSHPPEYIRKYLHLRSRTNAFASIMRVRDSAMRAIHSYFFSEGYINVNTPIITSNDCEGAGEVFTVQPQSKKLLKEMQKHGASLDEAYFDSKAFLTVSGQLHLEAIARGLGNVYTFGPTFRAENSRSRHHLSEFYMVEGEAAFMSDLNELLSFLEKFLKCISQKILEQTENDVKRLQNEDTQLYLNNLIKNPFEVLTYSEACKLIEKHFKGSKLAEKEGPNKEQELFLVDYLGKVPVFLVEWPKTLKPFYMKEIPGTSKVAAVDLLVPQVGELCGGGVRENDFNLLQKKLSDIEQTDSLKWYLELREFGNIPTAGFGMGFERYLQFLLGVDNIKDTIPFPRWPHNCSL